MKPISSISINVQKIGKTYKLFSSPFDRVKETFHPLRKKYHKKFEALSNISFEVAEGDTIGIIGRNGSGKTTLLQLICGIMQPTSGTIITSGRISALLELGAGFNPEFSGRENVYLCGSILGLSRQELDACFNDIIVFADIGKFIDQPVKTYSSGMYVRLAFSLAINVRPDILVVDEALAVGDNLFQAKCYAKFRELQQRGITIIFVTHSLDLITRYCNKACLLDRGELKAFGTPQHAVDKYNKIIYHSAEADRLKEKVHCSSRRHPRSGDNEQEYAYGSFQLNPEENRYGNGKATIEHVGMYCVDGQPLQWPKQMEEYEFRVHIIFFKQVANPVISYRIIDGKGINISGTNTLYNHAETGQFEPGEILQVSFYQKMLLSGGEYFLSVGCAGFENGDHIVYDRRSKVLPFSVTARKPCIGLIDLDATIAVTKEDNVSSRTN